MDTLLVAGDHYTAGRGLPITITGADELIQRALIRLSVKRGAFPLEPRLGSELHRLRGARPDVLERLALGYAQEALAPMVGVSVERATVSREGRDDLLVTVSIRHEGQIYPLEVDVA